MKNNFRNFLTENKWLILILIAATFLRFFHLDYQSLWMDEIYTLNISSPKLSFKEFHSELILRDGFPHLYFILLKISYFFFGYSSYVARGFSALAGVVSVYFIYLLGKELLSKKAGLFAALLLTINEYNLYISQDARPYTLYLLVTIISFYALVRLLKNSTLKNAVIYGISAGLILNVNFFGFVNILSQMGIILFYFVLTPKGHKIKELKLYLISGAVALLLFAPNYQMFTKLFNIGAFWVPAPTPESFSLLFKELLGNSEITLFIFYPLFLFYLIKLFSEKEIFSLESIKNNKLQFSFILLFGWIFIFILFLMIKSYTGISLMLTRYFTSIIPVFFLVLGFGLYLIKSKLVRGTIVICAVVFGLVNVLVVKNYYTGINKAQFREASNFVIQNNTKKDVVYTSQKYWFDYYFVTDKVKIDLQETELENLIQQMAQDPTKIKAFWFVDAFGKTYTLSEASQNFVNNNFYIENNYDGFQAWAKHFILLKDVPKSVDISKFKELKQTNGDSFLLNLEAFENTDNIVKVKGWAYFDKQAATKSSIDIVLIKDGVATRLQTQKVARPDVTTYFKSDFDLSNSGFSSEMDIAILEPGKYQLAIYLANKETHKEGLILTDKFVEKQ